MSIDIILALLYNQSKILPAAPSPVWHRFFVTMYSYHPRLLAKSNIPKQNFSLGVNDICDGSPSRIRRVRRISLGMTTRPRSSPCVKRGAKNNSCGQNPLFARVLTAFDCVRQSRSSGGSCNNRGKNCFAQNQPGSSF